MGFGACATEADGNEYVMRPEPDMTGSDATKVLNAQIGNLHGVRSPHRPIIRFLFHVYWATAQDGTMVREAAISDLHLSSLLEGPGRRADRR
jgi:hypothetical protein